MSPCFHRLNMCIHHSQQRFSRKKKALLTVALCTDHRQNDTYRISFLKYASSPIIRAIQGNSRLSYLTFKVPRSLQIVRMHELSPLCPLPQCKTSSVRVHCSLGCEHCSTALLLPCFTPCPINADALLVCQTTVICNWASIDRATSLLSWAYSCDIIAASQQPLTKDKACFKLCLISL